VAKKKKKKKKEQKNLNVVVTQESSSSFLPAGVSEQDRQEIAFLSNKLLQIKSYGDVASCFSSIKHLEDKFRNLVKQGVVTPQDINKGYYAITGVNDIFGYKPQGTKFFDLFPNPFAVFGYLADNHWAFKSCRDEYYKAVSADGFLLIGADTPRQKEVASILRHYNIEELRLNLVDHCKVFGNAWVRPREGMFNNVKDLELVPPHRIFPIMDQAKEKIIAWELSNGLTNQVLTKDEVKHLVYKPALRNPDIGMPPVSCMLVDIEADMQASIWNNMVFQKGGLVGLVILMETLKEGQVNLPGVSNSEMARQLQMEMNANWSGARSGFGSVVIQGAKDVKKVNDIQSLDGAFHKTSDKTSKQMAHVLGVPHERLGIITNASQQYHAARLQDFQMKYFDDSIREVTKIVDHYLNTQILPLLGIRDVKIKAKDRNNSMTRVITQSGVDIATMDNIMTKDEYRVEYLKLPPLGSPIGDEFMRLSKPLEERPPASYPHGSEEFLINDEHIDEEE
jgi:hypothetical protein